MTAAQERQAQRQTRRERREREARRETFVFQVLGVIWYGGLTWAAFALAIAYG